MTRKMAAGGDALADAAVRAVFTCVVALFCLHAALQMAQDIFPAWAVSKEGMVWIQALSVFFIIFYEWGIPALLQLVRHLFKGRIPAALWLVRYLCKLGVPAAFGWACYRYMKSCQIDLEDGACAVAVQFLDKFNKHLNTSIQIWHGKAEWMGMALAFWTLVIFMGVLFAALALRRRVLTLLFPAAVLALELLIGYIPQWKGMALLFAALLFLQADGGSAKETDLKIHADQRLHRAWRWYVYGIPVGCLSAAAVAMVSVSGALSDATQDWLMDQSRQVQVFQKNTEKSLKDIWRGQFLQQQEGIHNERPYYTHKEMLRVTASRRPSEDVLLKGFCGTDYKDGDWVCETQAFADACRQAGYDSKDAARQLLEAKYDLYAAGEDRITWYYTFGGGFVSIGSSENKQAAYTVEHTGVHSQYAFLPYAVHTSGGEAGSYVGDVSVQKRRWQNVFSYDGWTRFSGSVEISRKSADQRKEIFQWYDRFVKTAYLTTSDQIPTLDEYLENYLRKQEELDAALGVFGSKKQNMQIRNWMTLMFLSMDQSKYDLQQDGEWADPADSGQDTDADHVDWHNESRMKIAQALRAALQQYQNYSLDLEPLAEGVDPVRYFLMESGKGYCVHFASAAVLLLRELGVPARYVSGYVARVSDFKQEGDVYVASVKDSSAHAWAEIYLDQIGWVPVDVTPADTATFEQAQTREGHTSETDNEGPTQADAEDTQTDAEDTQTDTEDTQTDAEDTQTDAEDTQKDQADAGKAETGWLDALAGLFSFENAKGSSAWQKKTAVFLLVVILPAALACGLLWWIARAWHAAVEREIKAGKYSAAVRRINRRMYRRLRVCRKVPKQEIPDGQYEDALKLAWQQIWQGDWTHYMEIARKAAYAGESGVSRQEAEFCFRIYQEIFGSALRKKESKEKG